MSTAEYLTALSQERLTAAGNNEEETRQRRLLDMFTGPEIKPHRLGMYQMCWFYTLTLVSKRHCYFYFHKLKSSFCKRSNLFIIDSSGVLLPFNYRFSVVINIDG